MKEDDSMNTAEPSSARVDKRLDLDSLLNRFEGSHLDSSSKHRPQRHKRPARDTPIEDRFGRLHFGAASGSSASSAERFGEHFGASPLARFNDTPTSSIAAALVFRSP